MVALKRVAELQLLLAIVQAFEACLTPDDIKARVDSEWSKYVGPFTHEVHR